jgi:hypothetical protein
LRPSPMDGPKGSNVIRLWGRANETRFLRWLIGGGAEKVWRGGLGSSVVESCSEGGCCDRLNACRIFFTGGAGLFGLALGVWASLFSGMRWLRRRVRRVGDPGMDRWFAVFVRGRASVVRSNVPRAMGGVFLGVRVVAVTDRFLARGTGDRGRRRRVLRRGRALRRWRVGCVAVRGGAVFSSVPHAMGRDFRRAPAAVCPVLEPFAAFAAVRGRVRWRARCARGRGCAERSSVPRVTGGVFRDAARATVLGGSRDRREGWVGFAGRR